MSLLLEKGRVVDGTGAPPFDADILIEDSRIAAIAPGISAPAAERIDCAGLAIAPGFIDAHSHSDLKALENRPEKILQGVVAEVVGNCGFSAFPCDGNAAGLREFANGILCGSGDWGWPSAREYLAEVRRRAGRTAIHTLTGHGSLRVAEAGMRMGALDRAQLGRMAARLADALAEGSVGFSTGLMYAPGSSAPFEELVLLASVAARAGAIYCTHMRSYFGDLVDAIDEQVRIAQAAGCRLQISHLQAAGRANWPQLKPGLERIEQARRAGVDVEFDIYPYQAGSTVLTQLLPQRALEGGAAAMLGRLANATSRREIADEMRSHMPHAWPDVLVTGVATQANAALIGLSLEAIASRRATDPIETVFDLLIEESADVQIVSFNQSEENLRALLTHPLCTVISDGFYVKGRPHPRLHGTFPELLGRCCRERRWFSLAEAVHKITAKPAARFGLKDRGVLRPGAWADITVFDPETVGSPATYEQPQQPPVGISLVMREGHVAWRA